MQYYYYGKLSFLILSSIDYIVSITKVEPYFAKHILSYPK